MKLPVFVFASLVAVAWPLAGWAQSPSGANIDAAAAVPAIEATLIEAIARAEPSVVAISRSTRDQPAPATRSIEDLFRELRVEPAATHSATTGAGVIIDSAGLVLTQYLAVREGDEHLVTTIDGQTHPATIRAADPRSGLAVLAIQPATQPPATPRQRSGNATNTVSATFPAIRFGDAAKLRKGQFLIAIGNPFAIQSDGQPTASWGIVTNLARKAPANTNLNDAPGQLDDYRTTLHHLGTLIQTDAKLGWSAGGGAVVTMRGELVGLTTTAATIAGHEQPAGYAIPINPTFRRIIDTLKQGREVEYGMLGVSFGQAPLVAVPGSPLPPRIPRVTVGQVFPGSPAARAGLQTGDIVTHVGEQPVDGIDAIQLAVSTLPPSTTTTIQYERGGRSAATDVRLAKLAVAGKKIATVRPDGWRGIHVDYATALDATELMQAITSNSLDPAGCVLVTEVEPDSAAWQAGVRAGMFISHVGNKRVATPDEFRVAVQNVGDELDIRLTRPIMPASPESQPQQ